MLGFRSLGAVAAAMLAVGGGVVVWPSPSEAQFRFGGFASRVAMRPRAISFARPRFSPGVHAASRSRAPRVTSSLPTRTFKAPSQYASRYNRFPKQGSGYSNVQTGAKNDRTRFVGGGFDRHKRGRVTFVPPILPPVPSIGVVEREQRTVFVSPSAVRFTPPPAEAFAIRPPAPRLPVAGVAVASIVSTGMVARRVLSAGVRRDSMWEHNKSVMRLTLESEKAKFTYEIPRAGLAALGISRGTLLFDGRNVGGVRFEGSAYTFSRQCGPAGYPVAGNATRDGAHLEVSGKRPIRNERCDVVREEEESLLFDLVANTARIDVPAPLLPVEQAVSAGFGGVAGDNRAAMPGERAIGGQAGEPVWMYGGAPLRAEVQDLSVRFFADGAQSGQDASSGAGLSKPLFDGRNISDTAYAGSAYAFSKQCGDVPFRVQGNVSRDGGRLELTGQRPELDDKCGVTGHRQETLVFELQ